MKREAALVGIEMIRQNIIIHNKTEVSGARSADDSSFFPQTVRHFCNPGVVK